MAASARQWCAAAVVATSVLAALWFRKPAAPVVTPPQQDQPLVRRREPAPSALAESLFTVPAPASIGTPREPRDGRETAADQLIDRSSELDRLPAAIPRIAERYPGDPPSAITSLAVNDRQVPTATSLPATRHRIVDGDTLASLAEKYLHDWRRAAELFEANRDKLSDPQLLPIGVELRIPPP